MVRFLFSGFSWSRAPSEAVPSQGAAGLPAHRCAVGATRRRASVTVHSQRLGRAFSHEEAGEHDPVVPLLLPESASRRVRVHHVKPVPKGVHHPRWVPADPEVVHQRGAPRSCRARTRARSSRRSPPRTRRCWTRPTGTGTRQSARCGTGPTRLARCSAACDEERRLF